MIFTWRAVCCCVKGSKIHKVELDSARQGNHHGGKYTLYVVYRQILDLYFCDTMFISVNYRGC